MRTGVWVWACVAFALTPIWTIAQEPAEGARQLYYFSARKKDTLPPIRNPRASTNPKNIADSTPGAGAVHLGLRYNLVLVNAQSGKSERVDPDRTLRTGDCFAIDIESNRSGYLYVLAKQSGGRWKPLLPSPEMAEESNIIDPEKKVRIPADYCFEVHPPAGTETLFAVLSRDPRDFYDLYESIRRENTAAPSTGKTGSVLASASVVDSAVANMERQFGTRDIAIRKVSQPMSADEQPHSVYVVNSSNQPASSLVTQIQVRHR